MLWPVRVVPFSVVLGKHTGHFDTGDLPFSLIEAKAQELETTLEALRNAAIANPSFAFGDLARSKAEQKVIQMQVETLRAVEELPKAIMDHGEKARLVLRDYIDE